MILPQHGKTTPSIKIKEPVSFDGIVYQAKKNFKCFYPPIITPVFQTSITLRKTVVVVMRIHRKKRLHWCIFDRHAAAMACFFTRFSAGINIAISSAMMEITNKSSINVNPLRLFIATP